MAMKTSEIIRLGDFSNRTPCRDNPSQQSIVHRYELAGVDASLFNELKNTRSIFANSGRAVIFSHLEQRLLAR